MIYPDNFERKIGFSEVRTLLKGRCMSSLGTEWVDHHVTFSTDFDTVRESLAQAQEFARFMATEEDVYEENFYDVRQPLMRIRPERTYLEELDLFDLKRSLQTVVSLVRFLRTACDEDEGEALDPETAEASPSETGTTPLYPALTRMTDGVGCFPQLIARIDRVLNKYGKIKDTATPELLNIRHTIEVTSRGISHSLRSIINQAQADGYIDRDVSPTLRDGRLVIPVAPALKRKIKGIIHDEIHRTRRRRRCQQPYSRTQGRRTPRNHPHPADPLLRDPSPHQGNSPLDAVSRPHRLPSRPRRLL